MYDDDYDDDEEDEGPKVLEHMKNKKFCWSCGKAYGKISIKPNVYDEATGEVSWAEISRKCPNGHRVSDFFDPRPPKPTPQRKTWLQKLLGR